ncbi:unnamed protein product (macronuclear) [Paramecium tetraurelia]|uniref:Uncharacterized protein n=1 Tax=Paramecium tetraurelia TaxID=5888 RepID=A0BQT0_PARTE|nr:uncharacterized protein GSPATT00031126001 [Paramecium tetraurelia]CAK60897.1 unnamed protein product [Paramecium tetraurelia]|eukprot:XP_001428295.1 hypothetical protein (macronuclear) [Paramecium tetraurelia strain d4-2]
MKKQPPPSTQQPQQIQSRIIQKEVFWVYQPQSVQQSAFEQYLTLNQKEIYNLQQQQQVGYMENIQQVSNSINNHLHPCLQNNTQDQFLRFNSVNVDWLTLKLIHLFINNSNLMAIDFRHNRFTIQELDVVYQIFAFQRITKAFIEYNPNVNILKLSPLYNLEFIYLRGNEIENNAIVQFMAGLHNRVRVLELGVNKISQEGVDAIAEYMGKHNVLEYLGLAQNSIKSFQDIKLLANSFGKNRITAEEFSKIQELEQQRELQVQKFQKQKKKYTEEMLIQVPPYVKIDNFNYTLQNPQFKLLNLSDNQMVEQDRDQIDKFLSRLLDTQSVVLTNNLFEHSTRAKLRKKYKKCVVI